MKTFMMGAIKRLFALECKFELMLCFLGNQGAGKSTFSRFLAVRDERFPDDLRQLDDEKKTRAYIDQLWAGAMALSRQIPVWLILS